MKIKTMIFLFFISFSSFAQDEIPCKSLNVFDSSLPSVRLNPNSDWITIMPKYPVLSSLSPLYSKICKFASEAFSTISYVESSDDLNVYYYTIFAIHSSPTPASFCPFGISPLFALIDKSDYWFEQHNGCVSDVSSWGGNVEEDCFFYLRANVPHKFRYFFYCPISDSSISDISLSSSQETAIKKNDLISESNSKLGVIASTNSAITELLKQIKDALLSLNSANFSIFGIFGTNADSSDLSNKSDPNSLEFEPELSSSGIAVSAISSSLSKNSSCPSDISISIMNSTHYLSYQPLCDFLKNIRSLVVPAARVAAAWLVIGAL